MAYVKVMYRKNADKLIQYCFNEKKPDDPVQAQECPDDEQGAKRAFEAVRNVHRVTSGYQAVHVIQSWSPEESKKITPAQVNKMGEAMASRYFEGHQFLVVTHSHDDHLHNHIIVNTVAFETGKRITNKKKHLYKLRNISDDVCRENGLSVIDGEAKDRRARMPDRVDRIERYNGNSYIYAMKDKAAFARHYATGFDEYTAYLKELGVQLRIKDKAITYFYEDKKKGKRGDKLGREFTREGLEKAFEKNHELFSARPDLRAKIRDEFARVGGSGGHTVGNSSGVFLDGWDAASGKSKDFASYTKSSRPGGDRSNPNDHKLRDGIIPIEAVRRARSANVLEYCARHKIELSQNDKGQTVLKGREHVVVGEKGWTNTKNRTKGTAIEFAAVHGNLSYLQAIARINGTPALLELEKSFGEVKRKFTSFHVPRRHEMSYPDALKHLSQFLNSFGSKQEMADPLLRSDQVSVQKNGVIRFLSKGDTRNSIDFAQDHDGKWSQSRRGRTTKPFYASRGTGKSAVVFSDPKQFIEKRGADLFSDRHRKDGILVLLEPSADVVEQYVKANPHVKDLELVTKSQSKPEQGELDFFGNLKSRLRGLGVNVHHTEHGKALPRRGHEIDI